MWLLMTKEPTFNKVCFEKPGKGRLIMVKDLRKLLCDMTMCTANELRARKLDESIRANWL